MEGQGWAQQMNGEGGGFGLCLLVVDWTRLRVHYFA